MYFSHQSSWFAHLHGKCSAQLLIVFLSHSKIAGIRYPADIEVDVLLAQLELGRLEELRWKEATTAGARKSCSSRNPFFLPASLAKSQRENNGYL